MKHLKVEYNGIVLFDGDVDEVTWSDGSNGVTVTGKVKGSGPQAGGVGGFLDMLTAASRRSTENTVNQKKAELAAETSSEFIE